MNFHIIGGIRYDYAPWLLYHRIACLFLLCIRTSDKSYFLGALFAHQMEIAFVITVSEGFRSIENGSLHFKCIIIHSAQMFRNIFTSLLPCKFANAALLMRNIIFVFSFDLIKKIIPIHRIFFYMVSGPF